MESFLEAVAKREADRIKSQPSFTCPIHNVLSSPELFASIAQHLPCHRIPRKISCAEYTTWHRELDQDLNPYIYPYDQRIKDRHYPCARCSGRRCCTLWRCEITSSTVEWAAIGQQQALDCLRNGGKIRRLGRIARNDAAVLLKAIALKGACALSYASDARRDDAEFMHAAVEADPRSLQYASLRLRDDASLVRNATERLPRAVWWGSERLRTSDETLLFAALERCRERCARPRTKSDGAHTPLLWKHDAAADCGTAAASSCRGGGPTTVSSFHATASPLCPVGDTLGTACSAGTPAQTSTDSGATRHSCARRAGDVSPSNSLYLHVSPCLSVS